VQKLIVRYVEERRGHLASEKLIDVLIVDYHFERDTFAHFDVNRKKCFFLESIGECLAAYAVEYGWDTDHCAAVQQRIQNDGIVFDRWWGKPVGHSQSGRSVRAHMSYYDVIRLSLGIFDRHKALLSQRFVVELPATIGAVYGACAKLEWVDENLVRMWQSNFRDYWDFQIDTNEITFHYPRAERGDPHGQYDLGNMYLDGYLVPRDRQQALLWLKRSADQGFSRAIQMLNSIGGVNHSTDE
jgi:Sel1 repeat